MIPLHQLLARFSNLTNTDKVKKQLIMDIFLKNKLPVNINQISLLKNTLFIKTQPIIKTEILFKKEEILNQVQKIAGLSNISNIR
ncbi:MAG: hypothetical protein A2747_02190 [Candidatus Yonathbacteria bacterium RIFCSPHIGHO2_01_FULL_44_41]|uniref:Uncharacterized protein n=1 Tax=Candidatus Yonathbacteria bacterium RIFCSPHIGHO2_02_FULL_44_14 TaxID=1802724 RepID=A0A1G2S6W0_9BACT|nr:MAG: hypothetical protein A2747_02190 [Candidatus Yonathbacteria bacterium RIFCSPHIGHO2_01_FULL_44_41]OHA80429.1 MAG: hypothetical protein A3D51_03365 [Candidatus Yonathbacteria bacterium RIFCSPHIGHO2_02_FULL_44_14]OHA81683.1 MAG: hypothetical protein A3B06_02700 [Candidatus Yonathbacteria bacterium RIFCSPLOWO2_01_FULL_43_20]